jgi:hypothetical protein
VKSTKYKVESITATSSDDDLKSLRLDALRGLFEARSEAVREVLLGSITAEKCTGCQERLARLGFAQT